MAEQEYLTPKEVGEKLRLHERTERRLSVDGQLIGAKNWRVSTAALKAYIEAGEKDEQ